METKKYKRRYTIYLVLSILVTLLPIIVYTILGLIYGDIGSKVCLGMCLLCSIVFVLINIVLKHRIKSTIWVLLLGIYMCVDNIVPLLLLLAFGTMLDEFVLEPSYKRNKNKYIINKEIDKRG